MKQILKLAELNWALTLANRAEIAARATKDDEAIDEAKLKVESAQIALDKQLESKRMESEINKYESRKDEVRAALVAAGYDTAVMDFF